MNDALSDGMGQTYRLSMGEANLEDDSQEYFAAITEARRGLISAIPGRVRD